MRARRYPAIQSRRKRRGGGKAERRSPAKVKESNRPKTLRQWSD